MVNHLADAVSPYLLAHAGNPVDWHPWREDAFAEARERDVPVFVSIGYATCHWCHVMARESFSDPALAGRLNAEFVPVKVDREEHPDVDAAYLAAASAFTQSLGWPLSVFTTPDGHAFFAGTYFPPEPRGGIPSFGQILDAVTDAWTHRRDDVADTAARVAAAVESLGVDATRGEDGGSDDAAAGPSLPDAQQLNAAVRDLVAAEDPRFGGFGTPPDFPGPKFPTVPALGFLLGSGAPEGERAALHTLDRMADSALRDPVDGGFFRYGTRRDWGEPHYERMLYDNAGLLRLYADAAVLAGSYADDRDDGGEARGDGGGARADGGDARADGGGARDDDDGDARGDRSADGSADGRDVADRFAGVAEGIATFLFETMRVRGGLASAQDSESEVDGVRREGAYHRLDAAARSAQPRPALDEKVLTGWNGLAIGAAAHAGAVLGRPDWVSGACAIADELLAAHVSANGRMLIRASLGGRASPAAPALEDYGLFARGLLDVFLATGEPRFAEAARALVDATMDAAPGGEGRSPFAVPGGGDPVLSAHGIVSDADPSEGAYPGGTSSLADAARVLFALTDDARYDRAARAAVSRVARQAARSPIAFGEVLHVATALSAELRQLVVVAPDGSSVLDSIEQDSHAPERRDLLRKAVARRVQRSGAGAVGVAVTEGAASVLSAGGFGLFDARGPIDGEPTEYLCRAFTCELPRPFVC